MKESKRASISKRSYLNDGSKDASINASLCEQDLTLSLTDFTPIKKLGKGGFSTV
jgi:hypothetical protein